MWRIGIDLEYEVDDVYQHGFLIAVSIGREADPGDQARERSGQDPSEIERRVSPVEQVFPVIIMAACLAVPAIFRAFVLVLIPAGLVEHVLAFDYDLISNLERRLAIIAIRFDQDAIVAHVLAGITGDMFPLEYQVMDTWGDELENHVKQQESQESQQTALQDHLEGRQSVDDDGVIDAS